ncbi:hypothetical protein EMPS_01646 [Entomortierella parvispora]|uniref:Uncharacterized protein n=1 Tax=Entomortierella parvispora TaxID=205924 RepID=A0A9P3H381_9FUNG|nr:hypothetical protein EMPS_01646 [Entomortierella parvispora]
MGNLTLLCVARSEDDAALYSFGLGFNNSLTNPTQLIILLKAPIPPVPPSSLSSLTWSLVSMVELSKMHTIYSSGDLANTACAASSTGVYTFVSQYPVKGGFRYDPTLGSGAPPPPSTDNFQQSDPYWVSITVDLGSNWTSTLNVFPQLFYVPVTAGSSGTNGRSLVMVGLRNNTVLFAQENQTRGFNNTGTLQTPMDYLRTISGITHSNGRLYLIGAPSSSAAANQAGVLSMPLQDGHVSSLPSATDLKYYNSTPPNTGSPAPSCLSSLSVAASIAGNSLYFVCMGPYEASNTMFSIQNLATDTLVGPAITIPGLSTTPSASYPGYMQRQFEFFILTPSAASPPSASKGYGFLMRGDGPRAFPLDGSGPVLLDQKDPITYIPDLDYNKYSGSIHYNDTNSVNTLSGGALAGIAIGVVAFFTCAIWVRLKHRAMLRAAAQQEQDTVSQALQQQRERLAGHVFPDLNEGIHGSSEQQKGGAYNVEIVSSSPSSPPPLRPRPQMSPSTSLGLSYQPYTLLQTSPSDSFPDLSNGSSQEQFRDTLQLSSHPKPKVATTVTQTLNNNI